MECASAALNSPEICWPTSESITVQNALENIGSLMEKWKSVPGLEEWLYNVEFIALKANESSDFFLYEVKWSVPTPEYPIPQVTASVFFTIEAPRVKEESRPVEVTYVFEGTQFVHRPEIPFQQKWLYDILDVKTMLFKSLRF
ncbi:A-kinase anchor protein 14-like [Athalia rosae]|uniref:A-kinase anchor protein 14-like n=1 Tax=Athalia rosae TaxID=37344 RepID=UPI0020337E7C|nr:A-kinase anchor protein 14-like [Athalia rosae]